MNKNFEPEQLEEELIYDELEEWLSDQEALIDDLLEEYYYPNQRNHKKTNKIDESYINVKPYT